MGGGSSSQKPVFFDGQKELGKLLFADGGPFKSLLGGGPDAGFEAGVARSQQALTSNLAAQGLSGTPLAARAAMNLQAKAAQGREENRLETLLNAVQPAGTKGSSLKGGVFSK